MYKEMFTHHQKQFRQRFKKLLWPVAIPVAIMMLIGIQSCEDKCQTVYTSIDYEPVFMTVSELRKSVSIKGPQDLSLTGKIYLYKHYLLVNELNQGIHIIDNSNPHSPQKLSFVEILGNVDMAVKDDVLYADSYVDLVVFDISDMGQIKEINRLENVFPQDFTTLPMGTRSLATNTTTNDQGAVVNIVTEFLETEVTRAVDCNQPIPDAGMRWNQMAFSDARVSMAASQSFNANFVAPSLTGVGGSMARFTIDGDYLYTIDDFQMQLFNISNASNPVKGETIYIGFGIETIFPYKGHLFIGAMNGMYIYNIQNAANPEFVSVYRHANACDPVVVDDKYAYVTLRSGATCMNVANDVLEIIDIQDLKNPFLLASYDMDNPHGLGIDANHLFVCEGEYGLKYFDAHDPFKIPENLLAHYKNVHAFDVIPFQNLLIMVGQDGLYQYDYSTLGKLEPLSSIPIVAPVAN